MADFSCSLHVPDQPGLEPNDLTVGRVFALECAGPWPEGLDPKTLQVEAKPEGARSLKVLDAVAVSKDKVEFKVTSYTAGPVRLPALVVTNGQERIELGPVEFTVRSVLDPQQPKQEPYGPVGPMGLAIPLEWWITGAVLLVVVVISAVLQTRRTLRRRRFLRKLGEYPSPLSAAGEFHQRMRRLRREKAVFAGMEAPAQDLPAIARELGDMFQVYLMRRFRLPVFDMSDSAVATELRRRWKSVADHADEIRKLLKELRAAVSAKTTEQDVLQLSETSRRLIEKLERRAGAEGGRS